MVYWVLGLVKKCGVMLKGRDIHDCFIFLRDTGTVQFQIFIKGEDDHRIGRIRVGPMFDGKPSLEK